MAVEMKFQNGSQNLIHYCWTLQSIRQIETIDPLQTEALGCDVNYQILVSFILTILSDVLVSREQPHLKSPVLQRTSVVERNPFPLPLRLDRNQQRFRVISELGKNPKCRLIFLRHPFPNPTHSSAGFHFTNLKKTKNKPCVINQMNKNWVITGNYKKKKKKKFRLWVTPCADTNCVYLIRLSRSSFSSYTKIVGTFFLFITSSVFFPPHFGKRNTGHQWCLNGCACAFVQPVSLLFFFFKFLHLNLKRCVKQLLSRPLLFPHRVQKAKTRMLRFFLFCFELCKNLRVFF